MIAHRLWRVANRRHAATNHPKCAIVFMSSLFSDLIAADTSKEAATLVAQSIAAELEAKQVLVLRAEPPEWSELARIGKPNAADSSAAISLASDALDAEGVVQSGGWWAAPFSLSAGLVDKATNEGTHANAVLLAKEPFQKAIDLEAFSQFASDAGNALGLSQAFRSQRRRVRHLEQILEMMNAWRQVLDLRTLLEQIAEAATKLFGCDRASIFLWDRANKTLVGRPALGLEGNELRVPDDAGLVGQVLQSGEPQQLKTSQSDEIDHTADKQTGYQTRSLLGVPMRNAAGKLIGVFELLNKLDGDFRPADEKGLQDVARYAAVAIEAAQQFEELLERREVLVDQAASGVQLLGDCPAIQTLQQTIARVADTDLAILILGENGSGKEVIAQKLHYASRRRTEPFIAVNCAAITETLLESELFGHEKGAFTDASETREGKFELASSGTLFLDEIGDMSLSGQAKLLRVLEDKTIVRVGGSLPIQTDVRILAATNQDLATMVREKKFREDLYFRLHVVTLDLPPLRQRGDDILLLANHFLAGFCRSMGRKTPRFAADAKKRMLQHRWPGNVRELRNLMERLAYLSSGDRIEVADLAFTESPGKIEGGTDLVDADLPLQEATHEFQRHYIRQAIDRARGNVTDAASQLGVHRSNLYRKMNQLEMQSDGDED